MWSCLIFFYGISFKLLQNKQYMKAKVGLWAFLYSLQFFIQNWIKWKNGSFLSNTNWIDKRLRLCVKSNGISGYFILEPIITIFTKWWRYRKLSKTYISFNKQTMEYNNALIENQWKLLIIGLLVRTIIKTSIIFDQNSMSIIKKDHNKIKLASDKI